MHNKDFCGTLAGVAPYTHRLPGMRKKHTHSFTYISRAAVLHQLQLLRHLVHASPQPLKSTGSRGPGNRPPLAQI